uniref:RING-type domain-containing protein n=2 Tax=Amphimedon queenslandica TaxID=400682 RepID=A0A1X7TU16_AMPQE
MVHNCTFFRMAVRATSSLEELLTCSVCLEVYSNPKTLPCHHSFCQTCLEKLPKEDTHSFYCPTCCRHTELPDGGVAALSTAFYLYKCKEIHSSLKKEFKCGNCHKNTAANYCKMCTSPLCVACTELHNNLSKFSSHEMLNIVLVQNLLSAVEQFSEVKAEVRGEAHLQQFSHEDPEQQWKNIDQLLRFLQTGGGESSSVDGVPQADHLLLSIAELNALSQCYSMSAPSIPCDYYGVAIPRALFFSEFFVQVTKVHCTDERLLSFFLSIESTTCGENLIIPVSSLKCSLIPVVKGKEHNKEYKIKLTDSPGVYQVHCSPLSCGAHSLSVCVFDVQLDLESLVVPFNPHFDTITPSRAMCGLQHCSNVAGGQNGIVLFTQYWCTVYKASFTAKYFCPPNKPLSVVKSDDAACYVCLSSSNYAILVSKKSIEILHLNGSLCKKMSDPISFMSSPSCVAASFVTGFIYIADKDKVHILSSDLRFIRSFQWRSKTVKPMPADGNVNGISPESIREFSNVNGMALVVIDGEDFLYVTDGFDNRIQKFTHHGEYVSSFGKKGFAPGELFLPHGIAVGPGNLLYVAELGNHRISVFTFGGDFVCCFGERGSNIDQFVCPKGIAFDSNGVMYVCDSNNGRLVLY